VSLAHRLVPLIPTRRVSEGVCGILRPSLTLRVGLFPLPAANLLNQQAVMRLVVIVMALHRGPFYPETRSRIEQRSVAMLRSKRNEYFLALPTSSPCLVAIVLATDVYTML
jgi:hypothetical protein